MAFVANDPDELRDEADRYRTLAREFEGTVLADALRSSAEACDELARSIEKEGQPHGLNRSNSSATAPLRRTAELPTSATR